MISWTMTLLSLGLLVAMALSLLLGQRIAERQLARGEASARSGTDAIQAALTGLLALLLAFTVTGAAERLDTRRLLIVDETNAIATAYLRLDLLPEEAQPGLRAQFRTYLDSRISTYEKLPDMKAATAEFRRSQGLQQQIWTAAIVAARTQPAFSPAPFLLVPALNEMIDLTTTRTMLSKLHPPLVVFVMLAVVMLASALYAGYGMVGGKYRSLIHLVGFIVLNVFVFLVILDLEYPRVGLLREESFDQALVDLRTSMN